VNFIIPIIVGAIIGYITNWFAIKMLFRPRYKKEMFGIRIPFTPGLIPKEKERIAKSIGETVGVHLLSSEVFTEVLSGEKVSGQLQNWIKSKLNRLRNSDKTVSDLIAELFGKNHDTIIKGIEHKVAGFICSQLSNENTVDKLIDFIEDRFYDKYKDEFQAIVTEKIELLIRQLSTSQEIKKGLETVINSKIKALEFDKRALDKAIPGEIIDTINIYISSHKKEITNALKQMLEDPFVRIKLKASIAEIVSQNTSKIVTVFMSPENIAQKVISSMEAYFDNSENDDSILLIITTLVDKLLETKVSDIFVGIEPENKKHVSLQILNSLDDFISNNETQNKMIDVVNKKIVLSEKDIKESLMNFLKNKLNDLANNSALNEDVSVIVHEVIEIIKNTSLSFVFGNVDENTISNIATTLKDIYNNFIKSKLPQAIEALDISKVVEEKINSFDVAFVEEIIVEIANKELRAITWLGALLGGIMGVISPLLQLFISV